MGAAMLALIATLLALHGCGPAPVGDSGTARATDSGPGAVADPVTIPLDDLALLRRRSLDLTGLPPEPDQVAAVLEDPDAIEAIIEDMLRSPRWRLRFADMMAEQFLTRVDSFNATVESYGLDPSQEYRFESSVGTEPLLLMATIASADRPWTDVVTVDWTVADDMLLEIWPLQEISLEEAGLSDAPAEGWRPARYTDGRPAGGLIMTNGLWWRYWSAPANYNRGRAAALARLLLCEDFLLRPISFDASSLLDTDSLLDATSSEPACVGCHNSLDPLAAAFYGFWWFDIYAEPEMTRYHPEREWLGAYYLGTSPEYFGTPLNGPVELGPAVADDPRFLRCTTRRVAGGLLHREITDADQSQVSAWLDAFRDADLRVGGLVRAVLASEEYRAGALLDTASEDDEVAIQTLRMMSPDQLADSVEALTGFRWTEDGFDQLGNDDLGYRILAGGVDGVAVTRPQRDPSVSQQVVLRLLAQGAADFVVTSDLALPAEERRLLTGVDGDTTSADPAFVDQLETLHLRFHGRPATDDALAEETALFDAVAAADGTAAAWAAVIALLIRDPAFWTY
ncbi:MAG: DUF1549 domain-containing protein [Deltaproteobacteria bacterium]|nr:MAG: DUF1549 domain-containing protein [Deltaproteobacteria bacterium]